MVGIYKWTNKINGKVYIGQSINIANRMKQHLHRYKNEAYSHVPLYQAMNKYGVENFEFSVVEECSKEKLNEREIYWIANFNSFEKKYGYNRTYGGNSFPSGEKHFNYGTHRTEEQKARMSQIKKGSRNTTQSIWIAQLDVDGNFLNLYRSASEAANSVGTSNSHIIECCKHGSRFITLKGYQWCYATDLDERLGVKADQRRKENPQKRKIAKIDLQTGEIIEIYESCSEAARHNNNCTGNISLCCMGKIQYSKGFRWKYA